MKFKLSKTENIWQFHYSFTYERIISVRITIMSTSRSQTITNESKKKEYRKTHTHTHAAHTWHTHDMAFIVCMYFMAYTCCAYVCVWYTYCQVVLDMNCQTLLLFAVAVSYFALCCCRILILFFSLFSLFDSLS